MGIKEYRNGPLSLELWDGKKSISVTEGQQVPKIPVLKNCIVNDIMFEGSFRDFDQWFRRITRLVGVRPLPVKEFTYAFEPKVNHLEEMVRFRKIYSIHFLAN